MIRKINLQNRSETKRLLHLQKASYTVEATLIGFYDIPPLNDTIEKLQRCGETFYDACVFMKNQVNCKTCRLREKNVKRCAKRR